MINLKKVVFILVPAVILALLPIVLLPHHFGPRNTWQNEDLHTVVETFSGLASILIATTLLIQKTKDARSMLYPGAGLFGAGILYIFHAISAPGESMVLLYTMGTFVGGLGFSLVWLPNNDRVRKRYLIGLVIISSVVLGLYLISEPTPFRVLQSGTFAQPAKILNTLSGLLYLSAAVYFLLRAFRSRLLKPYVFGCLSLLFAVSALSFVYSALWDDAWWIWHGVRLLGYVYGMIVITLDYRQNALRLIKQEKGLQEEQSRHKTMVETALDGFIMVSIEGRFLDANESYCRLAGYTRNELLKMSLEDIDVQDSEVKLSSLIRQAKYIKSNIFITKQKCKDGSTINIEISVNYLTQGEVYFGFIRDITDRMRIELEKAKLKQAIDSSTEAIFLTDNQGTFTYVNPAFTRLYGYEASEIIGENTPRVLKSGLLQPEAYELFWQTLLSGQVIVGELINKSKDGRLLNIENSANPIFDNERKIIGFLGIQRDVTERKRLQEQLIAQDRLVSIGQLVSGVAHELNNPLTSVIGFSDLLLLQKLPKNIEEDLKIINDEAKRSANIVRNLLTFARKQPQEKHAISLNDPLQTVLQLREHQHSVNNIKVDCKFEPHLPPILANSSQLQQVFFNIVTNAEQAMIEAHNRGTLKIVTERKGELVWASIADDGPGISKDNMALLFTPFFTTKEVGKGTGLGLSISQGIIAGHGGRVWAESEQGKGTTFFVELPIDKSAPKDEESKLIPNSAS